MSQLLEGFARRGRTAAKVHAGKDEDGAEEEPGGDLLVEEPPGKEYGGDGIEIDPVGGNNGSEFAHNPVPKQEAEHRGDDAQEEDAPNDFRAEDNFERGEARYKPIVRNDGQESVEKHFPGNQQGAVIHGCRLHD